jgi:hypothetical protein
MRWAEEVELLQEEMRRVSSFLRWHAGWWDEKGLQHRILSTAAENEGMVAYACRQAQLRHDLADCFDMMWAAHLPTTATTQPAAATVTVSTQDLPDLNIPELPPL